MSCLLASEPNGKVVSAEFMEKGKKGTCRCRDPLLMILISVIKHRVSLLFFLNSLKVCHYHVILCSRGGLVGWRACHIFEVTIN
jgi:hypothetical protein